MKSWTPDASDHFENWLGRVRQSVAADPALNPDDITQDLRAHVHAELETMSEPVTIGALDLVLQGLGNPSQWTDAAVKAGPGATGRGVRSYLNRANDNVGIVITDTQKALAGDWGMPVLLAMLTLLAIPTFGDGGVVLLAFAYFVARAQVQYAPHKLMGRSKWLVYFPLAIGAGWLAGIVLAFPVLLQVGNYRGVRVVSYWNTQFSILWTLGLWWVFVGLVTAREPKRVQAALRPFADGFEATHGRFLAYLGGAFMVLSTIILAS